MSAEIERFIPVAALLIALVLGFAYDVLVEQADAWKLAVPIGLVIGFGVRWVLKGKLHAR